MRTAVILNPVSGRGRARNAYRTIKRQLEDRGIAAPYELTARKGDGRRLALKYANLGYNRVIVCGGDGTILEAVNGLANTDVLLGIIPLGTGNDLCRTLGISRNIPAACSIIHAGTVKEIDIARVNGATCFAGVGAIGFDSEVAALAERLKGFTPDILVYLIAIFAGLAAYTFKHLKISFGDETYEEEVLLAAFGNSKFYGGGIMITPQAEIDDGKLDLCIVRRLNKLRLLLRLPAVYRGRHSRFPEVSFFRTREAAVESDAPLNLYGDGELVGRTPLTIEVMPKAMRVLVP